MQGGTRRFTQGDMSEHIFTPDNSIIVTVTHSELNVINIEPDRMKSAE